TGGVDGGTLDCVGVDGGKRGVVRLARTDADYTLDLLHEDLSVAHFAGARRREDGLDARLDERLRAHHFDLHFLVELHDECRTAILLDQLVLAAVSAHAAQRDAGDAGAEQRGLDLGKALRADDRRNQLHAGLPVGARWSTGSVAAVAGAGAGAGAGGDTFLNSAR